MSEEKVDRERVLSEEEFGKIFSDCHQKYIRIASSYIHDDGFAEDIVNDCFIKMWTKRDEMNTANYESYLFKSVINSCLNHLKAEQRHTRVQKDIHEISNRLQSYEINSLQSMNPEALLADELETLIGKCLSAMPDITKKVFISSRVYEKTYSEIADIYGISVRQVTSNIQSALKYLRASLKDYLPVLLALLMLVSEHNGGKSCITPPTKQDKHQIMSDLH